LIEKIIQWLKKSFHADGKKKKYIIVIAIIGLALILVGNLLTKEQEQNPTPKIEHQVEQTDDALEEVSLTEKVTEVEGGYEADLQAMLNQIKGVSKVEVMVNVDSTNVQVYEKDLIVGKQTTDEIDKNGGERTVEDDTEETSLVYVRQGDQEVPVKVKTKKPEVRGVFVIAKGANDPVVKKWIIESVSKVLDVPTYRISVMPK